MRADVPVTTAATQTEAARSTLARIPPWVIVVGAWFLIVLVTHPNSTSDTLLFVESVIARFRGQNYNFWDFGHLFWRAISTMVARVVMQVTGSSDPRVIALNPMIVMSIVGAGGSAVLLAATLRRLHTNDAWATAVAIAYLLTHGMIVHAQNGTSYMPGMFFLVLGLYFAVVAGTSERRLTYAAAAGVAAALSATLWFSYVIVIPAVAVAALVLGKRRDYAGAGTVLLAAAVTGCVAFIGTALMLGQRTPAEFWEWFSRASHGIEGIAGLPRAALGFARSLLFVGEDGGVMRRFLSRDPYAPVTLLEFALTRVWLLGLIWLTGLVALWHLIRAGKLAVLWVFAAAAIPVMAFAVMWQGGDATRWFPLYPFLFVVIHAVLVGDGRGRALRRVLAAGLVFMALNNVILLSTVAAEKRRDEALERIAGMGELLHDGDLLFCTHYQDDLAQVPNMFPFEPLHEGRTPTVHILVELAAPQVPRWRAVFARRAREAWDAGHQVWLSRRMFSPTPQPDWEWIEGTDPRIRWRDFYEFFSGFEVTDPAGIEDGFLRLERTPGNEARLAEYWTAPPGR
jgi:hypothetical protein